MVETAHATLSAFISVNEIFYIILSQLVLQMQIR